MVESREFVHTSRSMEVACYNRISASRNYIINKKFNPLHDHWLDYTECWLSKLACWPKEKVSYGYRAMVRVRAGARKCTPFFLASLTKYGGRLCLCWHGSSSGCSKV